MNNTVENVQKEKYTFAELEQIADRIYDRLSQLLDENYIHTSIEIFPNYGIINVEIGTKFLEISEAVASMVENELNFYGDNNDTSEEEIEEYFEEQYTEFLEEINGEHTVYVNGKIETQKYTITFEPLECEQDYCVAGLYVQVELKDKIDNIDIENIANLIADVFHL